MAQFETITLEVSNLVARITFCRPKVHNAFNSTMIEEMTEAFNQIGKDAAIRVVVITGEGKSFCAGADLNWMRAVKDYSFDRNLEESLKLAALFRLIYEFPKPVISKVNGAAIGGGTGFVAVTDIAISTEDAVYSFSEVNIGLVPACISPYVVKRVGEGKAREFFLTGQRLSADKALQSGLVNRMVPENLLDDEVEEMIRQIVSSGPAAIGVCKELLKQISDMDLGEAGPYTAKLIADMRQSDEGQEGMDAFLNKRKPNWIQ